MDFGDFDDVKKRLLIFALAAFLDISPEEVHILSVTQGSVKVTLALPPEQAEALCRAADNRDSRFLMFLGPLLFTALSMGEDFSQHLPGNYQPLQLRRVRLFADCDDEQLERLSHIAEIVQVPRWTQIVTQGEIADAMYCILEGEVRVRLLIQGKECILSTLMSGESFGQAALFSRDSGVADVITNTESVLLRISLNALERMRKDAPDLAAAFLYAVGKSLTAQIREWSKRYRASLTFSRAVSKQD